MHRLSVVIPVYGCADCLHALYERLQSLRSLCDELELVFVDDRSRDGAWPVLRELADRDSSVRAIRLSRNFGQSTAITAGIEHATGDHVVVMDCDLQDRPEDVALLYERLLEGNDIVFSRRVRRQQPPIRRLAGHLYFLLRNRLLGMELDPSHGSLMLMKRNVVDAFLRVRDRDRHHVVILHWLGFEQEYVDLPHHERYAGRSSYTLRKLLASAADGMFFQTSVLLRWIVYLGFALVALGVAAAIFLVVFYFLVHPYPGWTSLAALLLVVGGFIILSTGISALYVGKIFEQTKDRPLYVVDEDVGALARDRVLVGEPDL